MFMEGNEDIKELTKKGMAVNWERAIANKKTNDFQIIKRCMEMVMKMPAKGEAEKAAEHFITEVIAIRKEAEQVIDNIAGIITNVPQIDFSKVSVEDVERIRKCADEKAVEVAKANAEPLKRVLATVGPFMDTNTRDKLTNITRVVLTIALTKEDLDKTMDTMRKMDPNKLMSTFFSILDTSMKTERMSLQTLTTAEVKLEEMAAKVGIFSHPDLVTALAEQQFILKCIIVSKFFKKGIEV
jgi:hypothetical protein